MNHEHCHCCPRSSGVTAADGVTRRVFLAGMTAGGALLANLGWSALMASAVEKNGGRFDLMPPARKPLVVLPILVYDVSQRREGTSWRGWGGIDSQEKAAAEANNIRGELESLRAKADFPVEFLPVAMVNDVMQTKDSEAVKNCDAIIVYGAGNGVTGVETFGKEVIMFQRWKSGPVYLQYEIVSPRFLRRHTDSLALENITFDDVVTDSLDELTWRLRALCGLKNSRGTRILAIGGPDAWAQSAESKEALYENLRRQWQLDIQTVTYEELDALLAEAQNDPEVIAWSKKKTDAYLKTSGTRLSVARESVEYCFILDYIFRVLMKNADCSALTVFGCMTTIIPKAKTTACLTLSTLNDDGYLVFCESDFAVIPSGIVLANICGKPVFLNDPTYPHDGIVTLAHCTAPRKMDGKTLAPVEIVTHFESDFGAAPKVEMKVGQVNTIILPDFQSKRWAGFRSTIADNPFQPICRSQVDVAYTISDATIAERMPGFHWMLCYGDYMKEIGYVLRRVGIEWDDLESRR